MTEHKSIQTVVKELKELFEIDENKMNGSYEINGKFGISKKQMERGEVIQALSYYFADTFVEGGYVSCEPITLVHTCFEVKEGEPNKN